MLATVEEKERIRGFEIGISRTEYIPIFDDTTNLIKSIRRDRYYDNIKN